jgi:hypothetical protein
MLVREHYLPYLATLPTVRLGQCSKPKRRTFNSSNNSIGTSIHNLART